MPQPQRTIAYLNMLDREQFVAALGFAWEQSPWIAAAAWDARPFHNLVQLHAVMRRVVERASTEQQIALIQAHPDLAGKAAIAGDLTPESMREQASAGLDRLTPDEFAEFTRLNDQYRTQFGFPFVICVREHTKTTILESFRTRLAHDRLHEIWTALDEIAKIALLRLQDVVDDA